MHLAVLLLCELSSPRYRVVLHCLAFYCTVWSMLWSLNSSSKRAVKYVAGVAVATPAFAVIQASLLLLEYRINHGNAPRPDSPSRGLAIAGSRGDYRSTRSRENQPLRLLVIGDSLAAGVGVSNSSSPVLPQTIAQSLSRALNGRPVMWTCIGTPGYSSTQILQEIYELPQDPPIFLLSRLADWQREQRQAAQKRMEVTSRKARSWWQKRKATSPETMGEDTDTGPVEKAGRFLRRMRNQIQRELQEISSALNTETPMDQMEVKDESGQITGKQSTLVQRRPTRRRLPRKDSVLHSSVVEDYDVAIVLTGINDLKDIFLPFLMSNTRKEELARSRDELHSDGGFRGNLILLVDALRSRMNLAPSLKRDETLPDENCINSEKLQKSRDDAEFGPLVVFPAIPTSPSSLSQMVPLRWFLIPLIRSMDRNKQALAELYPELVLFVRSPSANMFAQAESLNSPLWDSWNQEQVGLRLTDIAQQASERVEKLMSAHYESWVRDTDDEQGQYVLADDSIAYLNEWELVSWKMYGKTSML